MELSHTVALGYAFTSSNVPVWLWMLSAIIYRLADHQPDLVDHVRKPLHDRLAGGVVPNHERSPTRAAAKIAWRRRPSGTARWRAGRRCIGQSPG